MQRVGYSSGHVETNCPGMHSREDFLPHKEYTSFSFAISAIGVHQFCLSISSISVRFSVEC